MGGLGSMWDEPLLTRYFTRMAELSRNKAHSEDFPSGRRSPPPATRTTRALGNGRDRLHGDLNTPGRYIGVRGVAASRRTLARRVRSELMTYGYAKNKEALIKRLHRI